MLNLYLTYKAFHACFVDKQDNFLTRLLKTDGYKCTFYTADEEFHKLIFGKQSPERDRILNILLPYDYEIHSGLQLVSLLNRIGNGEKLFINAGLASSIFVLGGISKKKADEISKRLGVLCFAEDDIPKESYSNSINAVSPLDNGKKRNWQTLLDNYNDIRVNTIIINDKYLQKDIDIQENRNKINPLKNIKEILKCLVKKGSRSPLSLLFLFGTSRNSSESDENKRKQLIDEIVNFLKNEIQQKCFMIETLRCKESDKISCYDSNLRRYVYRNDLYFFLHNRFIITNYGIISAENSLNAFDYDHEGTPNFLQTISSTLNISDSSGLNIWETYRSSLSKKVYEKEYECQHLTYADNDMNTIASKHPENRLLSALSEGEKCCYLSVPYDNDWEKIEIIEDNNSFKQDNYATCIYAKTKEDLIPKRDKIRDLFGNMNTEKYPQCPEGNNNFYRIIVSNQSNFENIIVQSPDGSKSVDQKQYINNCFLNKDDAIAIARQIGSILKGVPVKIQ